MTTTHPTENTWFTTSEAANYLRLSPGSLRTFRSIGKGPRYHKAGRAVRYRRDQLDSYLDSEAQQHSAEHGRS